MKKKHLELKQLKLSKETIVNMSAAKGGAQVAPGTADCVAISGAAKCAQSVQIACMDTQGTQMPCCPACLSGANNTLVKQYCNVITQDINCQIGTPVNPVG